jgi:membrane AbrB-like protein
MAWEALVPTLVLALLSAAISPRLPVPAGAFLLPLVVGAGLQGAGLLTIWLPSWMLAVCYAVIGWSIGLRFTRPMLRYAFRALPRVLASILTLVILCGLFSIPLAVLAGVDPLTAYLATSPGGADSVAIIAASSTADVGFVMAMQTVRMLLVIISGPQLAKFIARRAGVQDPAP